MGELVSLVGKAEVPNTLGEVVSLFGDKVDNAEAPGVGLCVSLLGN